MGSFKELYDHMTKVGHTGLVWGCFGSGFSPLVVGKPARLIIRCLLEIKYKNCISWLKFLFLHLIWLPKQTLSSQGYLGFSKVDLLDNFLSLWEDLKMNLFDKYYCKGGGGGLPSFVPDPAEKMFERFWVNLKRLRTRYSIAIKTY